MPSEKIDSKNDSNKDSNKEEQPYLRATLNYPDHSDMRGFSYRAPQVVDEPESDPESLKRAHSADPTHAENPAKGAAVSPSAKKSEHEAAGHHSAGHHEASHHEESHDADSVDTDEFESPQRETIHRFDRAM